MGDIIMRGNTSIMKTIQQEAKKISEANGIAQPFIQQRSQSVTEGGAANSIKKLNSQQITGNTFGSPSYMYSEPQSITSDLKIGTYNINRGVSGNVKFDFTKSALDRLIDSIELSTTTKEYVNVIQSMFSLYALGYLDSSVLDKLSREDLNEIKGILREFRSIIESY